MKYKTDMLQAITKEIILRKQYLAGAEIETVYFGGGTPSLLSPEEINRLLNTITENFLLKPDAEITIEANPDDIGPSFLSGLKKTSVNRFSIGIQSFFEEDLRWMNRAHSATEAETCVYRVRDAGYDHYSVDLIYGFPLLSHKKWQANLEKIIMLDAPHISAYSITVEPKTALASFIKKGLQPMPDENLSAQQFIFLMDFLGQNEFDHYEISNFCKPGRYAEHNTNYWKGVHYLGVGPSAHSYNGASRHWNVANNTQYTHAVFAGENPSTIEYLTEKDKLNEYIMTGLRTKWGINLQHVKPHQETIIKLSEGFILRGWMAQTNNMLTLTQQGKHYADHIASELFLTV